MYKVLKSFTDRFDKGRLYGIGDFYPREGFTPPGGRVEALSGAEKSELNRSGGVFLEIVETDTEQKEREASERESLKAKAAELKIEFAANIPTTKLAALVAEAEEKET